MTYEQAWEFKTSLEPGDLVRLTLRFVSHHEGQTTFSVPREKGNWGPDVIEITNEYELSLCCPVVIAHGSAE